MCVCDKHLTIYYEQLVEQGRKLPRPTPAELVKFREEEDPELVRVREHVQLCWKIKNIIDEDFITKAKGREWKEEKEDE